MISQYLEKQLKKAKYKILDDGVYFGEIAVLKGVWASSETLEGCRNELREVLEDWMLLKIRDGERVPGFKIQFDKRSVTEYA